MVVDLTPLQIRLLRALNTYRLLNVDQLRRVGVGRDLGTLRRACAMLENLHLVGATSAKLVAGVDHLPALHWLKEPGAAALGRLFPNEPAAIAVRHKLKTSQHIKHRILQVEVNIGLRAWAGVAGVNVGWYVTDFERGALGRGRATTLNYSGGSYTCDALAEVAGQDGASRLLVVEVERGTEHEHLTPFRNKLAALRAHAESGLLSATLGITQPARFVIVFQSASMRDRIQATWPEVGAQVWGQFFIKAADELADFNTGWWWPGGRARRPLFSWATAAQPTTTKPLAVA